MRKKLLILALILASLLGMVSAQAENTAQIRGYAAKQGYQYVQFGSYFTEENGDRKPILWRVLRVTDGEAYMLSELILFAAPVHGDYEHYNRNWQGSDLYAYLNGTFKNDAFSPAEQGALLVRTEDEALVTLISGDEMRNASIGFTDNNARLCESTPYASVAVDPPIFELPAPNFWKETRNQPHLYKYSKGGRKYSPWWSRTPSKDYSHEQRRVMDEGKTGILSVGNSDMGVRPAITLDLSQVSILSGDGTLSSPFLLASNAEPVETAVPSAEPVTEVYQSATEAPGPTAKPTATPKPTKKPTATPKPTKTPKPTATPKATKEPITAASKDFVAFTAAADPQYILEQFPELTEEGFLPEGEAEFVYQDAENGLWLYASQSIRIQIQRKTGQIDEYDGKKKVKTWNTNWYETHIFCRDNRELLDFFPLNEEKYYKRYPDTMEADEIARKFGLVLAFNTDYFNYRVTRAYELGATASTLKSRTIGIEIRNGEIIFEKTKNEKSSELPPLDQMAFYPDGRLSVHVSSHVTAKELQGAGAQDVLSFGPILVSNGEMNDRATMYGKVLNPRTGLGMVEPGHYVHILADGRRSREEIKGVTCVWMAERFIENGCVNAINLDGGASSTLIFMGNQLNTVGNYAGGTAKDRQYAEMLGIGHSEQVK